MSEYSLTIIDVDWEDGNRYDIDTIEDSFLRVIVQDKNLCLLGYGRIEENILEHYSLKSVSQVRFKKVVNWEDVPVDTKIFVKDSKVCDWRRKHFAKYKNNTVYSWGGNGTSWSETEVVPWEYARLAIEED